MSQFRSPGPPPGEGSHSQESLPGDFSFKAASQFDANASDVSDNTISLTTALISFAVIGACLAVIFFGTFSLHMKFHLFTLILTVLLGFYNYNVYGKPEVGESVLDTYAAYSTDEDGFETEIGRGGKWFRLIFSLVEPLDPSGVNVEGVEPSRGEASARTVMEWLILSAGILTGAWWFIKYYFWSNGPFFHDIWGLYIGTLFFALMLWFGYWIYYRLQDGWLEIKQHTEALNYLLCRWVVGYGILWCLIAILWILDA